jgi:ApaG protein
VYEQETRGIIVRAEPVYLEAESTPQNERYVWAYTIEIENRSAEIIRLLTRRWVITDAHGATQHVQGEGVVGQQPVIEPGEAFRYTSACPLGAASGWMVGVYTMIAIDSGNVLEVAIPAFPLDSPYSAKFAN